MDYKQLLRPSLLVSFWGLVMVVSGCGGSQANAPQPAIGGDSAASQQDEEDLGNRPWVVDIEQITLANPHFRIARWTGTHFQMTLMSIEPGGEIGLEAHPENDQFIRIEQGIGRVVMGKSEEEMTVDRPVQADWAILIPAGYWHNLMNTGDQPLRLYSIYGPVEHPVGTLHRTFEDDDHHHHDHHQ